MKNIGFSRKLISMGYTSHRENIPGSYSTAKLIMWDNLKIKQDEIELDKTGYEQAKNLSCPMAVDIGKTEIGQDVNPFVTNYDILSTLIYKYILNVMEYGNSKKRVNTEISLTRRDLSCPISVFPILIATGQDAMIT